MNWFTSDEHYNHGNIITKFTFRPFVDTYWMNRELIKRHNERVNDKDVVYHLGDFKLTTNWMTTYQIIKELSGNHVFIRGNHDKNNGLSSTVEYAVTKMFNRSVLLIHRPMDAFEIMEKLDLEFAFVGHVHERWKFYKANGKTLINVGVDQWDYYPVDAKQIFKALNKYNKNGGNYEKTILEVMD